MINTLLGKDVKAPAHKEGDLFKKLLVFGEDFEIFYGYYEDFERQNKEIEPMPIYPDFLKDPKHTADGFPFVTKMQDGCKNYKGRPNRYTECAECEFYKHGDDFIGICICPQNKAE